MPLSAPARKQRVVRWPQELTGQIDQLREGTHSSDAINALQLELEAERAKVAEFAADKAALADERNAAQSAGEELKSRMLELEGMVEVSAQLPPPPSSPRHPRARARARTGSQPAASRPASCDGASC